MMRSVEAKASQAVFQKLLCKHLMLHEIQFAQRRKPKAIQAAEHELAERTTTTATTRRGEVYSARTF